MIIVHGGKCAIRCERGGMNASGNVCTSDGYFAVGLPAGCQAESQQDSQQDARKIM